MTVRRPFVITVLAVLDYLLAAFCFFWAVSLFLPAKPRSAVLDAFNRLADSDRQSSHAAWMPMAIGVASLLFALLYFFLARGLWKVKNWARTVTIIFCLLDLTTGSLPSLFGLLGKLAPVPWTYLAGVVISFLLFLYLVSHRVRSAFGVTTPRSKWLIPVVSVLTLANSAHDISKSKPELHAIRWHRQHGNQIQVNGVTFPIYKWYAPVQKSDGTGFEIEDNPGPLRSEEDSMAFIEVKSDSEVEGADSAEQRLADEMRGYVRAGYDRPGIEMKRFQMRVANQTLSCLNVRLITTTIHCYGNGPIAYVFFAGGNRSLDRFQHMMAEAR